MNLKRMYWGLAVLLTVVAGVVTAEENHHGHSHEHGHSHSETPKQVEPEKPVLPTIPKQLLDRLDFIETFQDGSAVLEKAWISSKNDRYSGSEWRVGRSFSQKDDGSDLQQAAFDNEKSLAVNVKHRHYGLTHVLEKPFDNSNKTLVFQYEVRYHDEVGCSGAYVKLLLKQNSFDATKLEEATPYVIMFGPDRCASTNKVHFIVRQKLHGDKWEEKHMTKNIRARTDDRYSHLYTLIIRPDNSFQVLVDQVEEASGNLLSLTDFNPPFGAPKEIDDPNDKKPSDWVDVAQIPDPGAKKPDDWDEDAPQTIPDPDAKKPEGWSDEDDGEWLPPSIPNPEYKGKWAAPIIPNPDYKGVWAPRKIPNPEYFSDERPSNLAPIGAIAFEILANDRGIAFDNIVLSHDEAAAKEFADLLFKPKQAMEKEHTERVRRNQEREARLRELEEGGFGMAKYYFGELKDFVLDNLIPVMVSIGVVLLSCIYFCCFHFSTASETSGKDAATTEQDNDDDDENEDTGTADEKQGKQVATEPAKTD